MKNETRLRYKDGTYYQFSQLLSKDVNYPVYSVQSLMQQSDFRDLTLNINGKVMHQKFEFKPYQSLMLKITPNGKMEFIDIAFVPKTPIVRPHDQQKTYF